MNKTALITGATSGIGKSTAILLAQNNFNVIITGRRKEKLDELTDEIMQSSKCEVYSISFDISKNEETEKAFHSIPEHLKKIDLLVNNAGLAAGLDKIQDGILVDWESMIDTNIKGLLYITRLVVPGMIKRNVGQIINVGSIAGKEVYPAGNVYCATKAAVDSLTKAMRIDLVEHGIRVTGVCPGMVETEFSDVRFKGDKTRAANVYKGLTPLCPDDIAEIILFAATRPPHVNINDILVMPTAQASAGIVHRK
ncbi:MAG: NAD(P)-dependent oxidoreductase [Bacteroidetes bacterium GWF2_38_335]|nr:MAG: NAD(P)-dependent oxidoreductase [Bacteroidetes bacterium GWF2_38_335]HBS88253.1 NAD(P)-dependent oxidoreductase [Bacteroidales bacterium]